ncbi:endonuclease III [Atopobacter phocae]|uniref:endonuclease III n=1 Tax=Atopobacter phocae TaxID=136492 RepID=UPI00046ED6BB|nr:endonuclease III [Atopobacter phocae]
MSSDINIRHILDVMAEMFPEAKAELEHDTPFQLLVATILSAQATDVSVNKATKSLFKKFGTPETMAKASILEIESEIKTIGLYRNKAKFLKATAEQLIEKYNGEVPTSKKELVKLPGVGVKTANVVVSVAFNIPAIAVDTHVERVSKRLGIVPKQSSVTQVEKQLEAIIPKEEWSISHHRFIFFGRYHCTSRSPKCEACPLKKECVYFQNL